MLNLYFQFFTSEIQKKSKTMNQKILLGLLTGVNRAFPFAHLDNNDSISKNIDQLYKLVHHGTFIVGLQSLSLLYQAFNTKEELSDRFYNAVYRSGQQNIFFQILIFQKGYYMSLSLPSTIQKWFIFSKFECRWKSRNYGL